MKPERFLLANSNESDDVKYIIHTEAPKALIQVNDSDHSNYELSKTYCCTLQNEVQPRYFTFVIAQEYDFAVDWDEVLDEAWNWHKTNVLAA